METDLRLELSNIFHMYFAVKWRVSENHLILFVKDRNLSLEVKAGILNPLMTLSNVQVNVF